MGERERLMLLPVIITMVTLMDMVMDTDMERGKLMLPLDIIIMDMVDMAMERERLMLLPVISTMVTLMDMVMDTAMERGKLMLPLDIIIMDMDMVVMAMDMDMERGRPMLPLVIIIMVMDMAMDMDMDTMVRQYLFISFSKFCCIH